MPHDVSVIATITMGLVLAFFGGLVAHRLRLPPLVGYLLAGVALGPFTPGFVGDANLASQLAEIGVILLMFGVGLHFSINDLLAVRAIALPGAIAQIAVATASGVALALLWGWGVGAGLVLGLALSVASTVVLLRALEQRNALDTVNGRIAVGWLIVEDLVMVLALVLLPALAGALGGDARGIAAQFAGGSVATALALTIGKVALFVALVFLVGTRVVPWLLQLVARTGSRELFTLSVLAIALGIAYGSAELFGVSFALGAFFAGVVLSESDFSHQAAADSLPLQDAFAVLFFVSVGMLFDPRHPGASASAGAGRRDAHRVRQVHCSFRHRARTRLSGYDGAHGIGQPGADRRVLVHPGRSRRHTRAATARRARPHPGRRDPFHHSQSARVCHRRSGGRLDPGQAEIEQAVGAIGRSTCHATRKGPRHRMERPCRHRRLWPRRRDHRRRFEGSRLSFHRDRRELATH